MLVPLLVAPLLVVPALVAVLLLGGLLVPLLVGGLLVPLLAPLVVGLWLLCGALGSGLAILRRLLLPRVRLVGRLLRVRLCLWSILLSLGLVRLALGGIGALLALGRRLRLRRSVGLGLGGVRLHTSVGVGLWRVGRLLVLGLVLLV